MVNPRSISLSLSLSLSVPLPPHPTSLSLSLSLFPSLPLSLSHSLPPAPPSPLGGDPSQLASLLQSLKSPTHSAAVQPASSTQPSLDQLRAWEEEKEALRRYPHTYTKLPTYRHFCKKSAVVYNTLEMLEGENLIFKFSFYACHSANI